MVTYGMKYASACNNGPRANARLDQPIRSSWSPRGEQINQITRKGKEYDLIMSIYIYRHLGHVVAFNAAMIDCLPGISTITMVRALGHNRPGGPSPGAFLSGDYIGSLTSFIMFNRT